MLFRDVETIWTECATDIAITMIGTTELSGSKTVLSQPANPMVAADVAKIMVIIASVPSMERRINSDAMTTTANAKGASTKKSSSVATDNVWLRMVSPDL